MIRKHKTIQALLALLLLPAAANAASPIGFDPDGQDGPNESKTTGALDWLFGSSLFTSTDGSATIPIPPDTTKTIQVYAHGALKGISDPDGNPLTAPIGLNANELVFGVFEPFEITYIARFGANATRTVNALPPSDRVDLELAPDVLTNSFEMYFDQYGVPAAGRSNSLSGDGFNNGKLILTGKIVEMSGNFARSQDAPPYVQFDQNADGDQWSAITPNTIHGEGANQVAVLVDSFDADFFTENLDKGSIIYFNNSQVLPFLQTNPAMSFATAPASEGLPAAIPDLGSTNGATGPDMETQIDPNQSFEYLALPLSCRVTGGGNDDSGITYDANGNTLPGWSGSEGSGVTTTTVLKKIKGKLVEVEVGNVWTFGGQAGANTGQQPQPKGELSHTNHEGPAGQWTFHMGTASAPPGTEIDIIQCSDPGWCRQARPAPTKQIDFAGIGSFRNIIDDGNLNGQIGQCASLTETRGNPNDRQLGTYHWAEVHIEDHGERGREGQHTDATVDPQNCPPEGTGTDAFSAYNGTGSRVDAVENGTYKEFVCKTDNDPETECPDFYRLRIYCGVVPTFDDEGNLTNFDEITAKKQDGHIYEVYGYIDGGNWQIHPLTGFDLHRR